MTVSLATDSAVNVRDSEYYFEDGSLVLLVEQTLFKVCKACQPQWTLVESRGLRCTLVD